MQTVWDSLGATSWAGKMNEMFQEEYERDAGENKHTFSIFCMMGIHLWSPGVTNKRFDVLFQIPITGFTLLPIEMGCTGGVGLGW